MVPRNMVDMKVYVSPKANTSMSDIDLDIHIITGVLLYILTSRSNAFVIPSLGAMYFFTIVTESMIVATIMATFIITFVMSLF